MAQEAGGDHRPVATGAVDDDRGRAIQLVQRVPEDRERDHPRTNVPAVVSPGLRTSTSWIFATSPSSSAS